MIEPVRGRVGVGTAMVKFRESATLDHPIEDVWSSVSSLDRELRWRAPWVVGLEQLDSGVIEEGTRIRGTTKAAGSTETYVNEVTEFDPPRHYAWRGLEVSGSIIGVSGAYVLEPIASDRTDVTIAIDYESTGLAGRLQMPIWRILGRRILRRFLRQLDEAAAPPPSTPGSPSG